MKALAPPRQSLLVIPGIKAAILPIALLLPLWAIGIFGRGYWKPDEPREADIVWQMHLSGDQAVPALADTPFLEKPPLLYWAAEPFMTHGHAPPWRVRLPHLFYASVAAFCVYLLALEFTSTAGAIVATLLTSSFLLSYQVAIWLATDAPLMAGVALSLLGLYRGYNATETRNKLIYYTLMHGGLTVAFMAKGAGAWLVPGCTFMTLIVWQRNYRELLRWTLYAGAALELICVGTWLWRVGSAPHGGELLQQLLWMNAVGRFVSIHSTAAGVPEYTNEHLNWFGKYLVEAPYFVFPWTFVVIAALRRGWRSLRERTQVGAWQFCVAATLPAFALLSVAHTGRDIYIAPLLIGVGIACGIWLDTAESEWQRLDEWALRGSRWLIAIFAAVLFIALPLTVVFERTQSLPLWPSIASAAVLTLALVWLFGSAAERTTRSDRVLDLYGAYMLVVLALGLGYFPMLNRQQDLTTIGAQLRADLQRNPLVLVTPDETTRAFVDLEGLHASRIAGEISLAEDVSALLDQQPQTRFLVQLREQHGPLTDRLAHYRHRSRAVRERALDALKRTGLTIEKQYDVPDGRSYALLSRQP